MDKRNTEIELKVPNIDLKRIHPMKIVLGELKPTKAKVSLYFHDVFHGLKSVHKSLVSHRELQHKRRDVEFVSSVNADEFKKIEYLEDLTFFLENAIVRMSAIRDKIALTSYVYYRHPQHLGGKDLAVKGCLKCGNKTYSETITEKNCNFGLLLRYLNQEKVNDDLSKLLRKINKDADLTRIVTQRNTISHRISEYHWIGLGLVPQTLEIEYVDGQEKATWALGSRKHELLEEIPRIEETYNRLVSYAEELVPIFFPFKSSATYKEE